ncbi:MAG: hypothetical protein VKJ02_08020 [Snowella sp.]|nr:hypothetical protein [Snowella sp.]
MNTKELILEEISKIEENNLEELYELVKNFSKSKSSEKKLGALAKLKKIKIQAPVDFAANIDLYLNGEKQIDNIQDLP